MNAVRCNTHLHIDNDLSQILGGNNAGKKQFIEAKNDTRSSADTTQLTVNGIVVFWRGKRKSGYSSSRANPPQEPSPHIFRRHIPRRANLTLMKLYWNAFSKTRLGLVRASPSELGRVMRPHQRTPPRRQLITLLHLPWRRLFSMCHKVCGNK